MEIKINLNRFTGKIEADTIPVVDEEVVLVFSSEYVLANCVVKFDDGARTKRVQALNLDRLIVPREFVKEGTLHIGVDLIAKNQVAKHFDVEPLLFVEVDGELRFKKALAEYDRDIYALKTTVKLQQEVMQALEARLAVAEAEIQRIWEASEL